MNNSHFRYSGNGSINETVLNKGNFISKYTPNANQILESAEMFLGKKYKQIGDGVFRSADGLRQFRMDNGSLLGKHNPWLPHVHLELFESNNLRIPYSSNHIPFVE